MSSTLGTSLWQRNVIKLKPFIGLWRRPVYNFTLDVQQDTGLKGLPFRQIVDLLKNVWRHISSCYTFSTAWNKKRKGFESFWFFSDEKPLQYFTVKKRLFLYLASATAVCMASSICWPVAACSSGMGTANRTPLCRPSDRVLAESSKKKAHKKNGHAFIISVYYGSRKLLMSGIKKADLPMSFAASSGSQTWYGEVNPLSGEKKAGKFFDNP